MKLLLYLISCLYFHIILIKTDNERSAKYYWNYWSNIQNPSQSGIYGQQSSYPQQNLYSGRLGHYLFPQLYRDYYPNSDCAANDGNRTGICVSNVAECIGRAGYPSGTCYAAKQQSSIIGTRSSIGSFGNQWQTDGIPVGICCLFEVTCGGTILQNGTYFRNPFGVTNSRTCSVTVKPIRRDICQLRLDFLVFDMSRPNAGKCDSDSFIISGHSQNSIVPVLCGYNSGQHIYVEMNNVYVPITLNILTVGNRKRFFDIRVTQLSCWSPHKAPNNCLQYYTGVEGNFRSFNYEELNLSATGYLNNLDYTLCFRKEQGFCTVTFGVQNRDFSNQQNFSISSGNPNFNPNVYFNIIANNEKVGPEEAGSGPYECTTDYLIINNLRLCGSRLNSQLYPETPNPMINEEVFDNSSGPIFARFVSNQANVSNGFSLNFRMSPCLING